MSFQADIKNLSPSSYLPAAGELEPATYGVPDLASQPLDPSSIGTLQRVANTLNHAVYLSEQLRNSRGIFGKPLAHQLYCGGLIAERALRFGVEEKTAWVAKNGTPTDFEDLARFAIYGQRPSFTTRVYTEPAPLTRSIEYREPSKLELFVGAGWGVLTLAWAKPAGTWIKDKLPKFGKARPIGSVALSR